MAMTPTERFGLRGSRLMALGLLVALLAGCEQEKPVTPPPPPEVGLAEVTKQEVPIVLELSGTITPVKRVEVIPRVSGFIFKRYFTEGTFVEKDAPLYLIDPRPFEEEVARLEAQLEGLEETLKFWVSEEKRYSKLAEQGAASIERLEATRAKLSATEAEIGKTKAELRNAKLDLSFTRINAPFYGRLQQTQINVGNLVAKQQDVLTELVQMDPIYVVFNLSRAQVFEVQRLQREGEGFATEDMIVEVIMPDGQLYEKKGKINFISFLIDPKTDSVTVRGIFGNDKNSQGGYDLIPGQYAPVRATVGSMPDALVIPRTAVVETQAGTHVYVVGGDNKVKLRMIEPGTVYEQLLVVKNGLEEGEKVVAVGVQKVKDGTQVKPTAQADPAQAESEAQSSESTAASADGQ